VLRGINTFLGLGHVIVIVAFGYLCNHEQVGARGRLTAEVLLRLTEGSSGPGSLT
jgi:hypothetical protein